MAQTTEVIREMLTPEERAAYDRNFERHKLLMRTSAPDPLLDSLQAAVSDLGDVFESLAAIRLRRAAQNTGTAMPTSVTRWKTGLKLGLKHRKA